MGGDGTVGAAPAAEAVASAEALSFTAEMISLAAWEVNPCQITRDDNRTDDRVRDQGVRKTHGKLEIPPEFDPGETAWTWRSLGPDCG